MLRDREHGGRLLAQEFRRLRADDPVVLGVTRGGIPVALEIAKAFGAPLDFVGVQKVRAPEFPEFTVAAVAEGGALYLHLRMLRLVGMTAAEASERAQQAAVELAQRIRRYRGETPPPSVAGRTALVVDDGVATGATACAAARAVLSRGATRVVLAAPVIAPGAERELAREFDEVLALEWPFPFLSLRLWYEHLDRLTDGMVVEYLRRGAGPAVGPDAERAEVERANAERAPADVATLHSEAVVIPCGAGSRDTLEADLVLPEGARSIVVFGTGSSRDSPRYQLIAAMLHEVGIGTLRCDLLTPDEHRDRAEWLPIDPRVLTGRIATVMRHLSVLPVLREARRGLYAGGPSAEAALEVAATAPELVDAVVVRAGQLDRVPMTTLARVRAPVLLVVGGQDENVLAANRAALAHLVAGELEVVPGATDVSGEPGALEAVGRLAASWFKRLLEQAPLRGRPPSFELIHAVTEPVR